MHTHAFCATVLTLCRDDDAVVVLAARRLAHYTKMRLLDGIPDYQTWELYVATSEAIARTKGQPHAPSLDSP